MRFWKTGSRIALGGVLLLALAMTGACTKKEPEEFGVSFSQDYACVDDVIKANVTGAKNCTYSWYLNDVQVDNDTDSYTITQDDEEKTLKVVVTAGEETTETSLYVSNLPVIYLTTAASGVGDNFTAGTLTTQSSKDYELTEDTGYDGEISIKLRGNSTKNRDKHPYTVKLTEKTDLLGLGESKHWVLLAEDIDHTLIRNQLVMKFAREIGMEEASNMASVVLFLNGDYEGVYTLSEQVRVGSDQVDVFDWEELAEDIACELVIQDAMAKGTIESRDPDAKRLEIVEAAGLTRDEELLEGKLCTDFSWASAPYTYTYNDTTYTLTDFVDIPALTGGWLLEEDFYHDGNAADSLQTAFLQNFYLNTPAAWYTNTEAYDYASKYLQTFEYALHSDDFTYHESDTKQEAVSGYFDWSNGWVTKEQETTYSDPEHDGYRYDELFEKDSLVENFLVCEFSRNWDCMKNSVFVYKDVDGLAHLAPVWDFDWAFGNANMYYIDTDYPTGWQTTDYYFTNEQLYQNYNWNRYLIKDRTFVEALYNKYHEIRDTVIEPLIEDDGWIDTMESTMLYAGKANDRRWSYSYREYGGENYTAAYNSLTKFINTRVEWFDEQFASVDTLYESLNSYDQAEDWWGEW